VLRVGLTGNVAAGKSTVLALFRGWGAAVVDEDELAREAVLPGTRGLARVVERFGRDLLLADGSLDRATLRRRVMAVPAEREALNAIVHPEVRRLGVAREQALRASGARLVVHDIPLLFEALDPAQFDVIVLVDAPVALRRDRVMRARGLSVEEADALIAAQQPTGAKRAGSHFVIYNAGTPAELERRAREVWSELQRLAGLG
jgi:dephospho-CoA kinase